MSLAETHALFNRYREAFNRLDGDAVADLWHADGSGITDSRGGCGCLTWWPDDAPMRANHRALCDVYRQGVCGQADFHIDQFVPMGRDHAFAHLQWTMTAADGRLLQRFCTGYQLLRTAAGPRVLLCTAHQEDLQEMKRHAAQ